MENIYGYITKCSHGFSEDKLFVNLTVKLPMFLSEYGHLLSLRAVVLDYTFFIRTSKINGGSNVLGFLTLSIVFWGLVSYFFYI